MTDLDIEQELDGRLRVTLSSEEWQLSIRGTAGDLLQLENIDAADWNARRSIRAGASASSPVFWAVSEGVVSVLVGEDDELYDVAITIPIHLVHTLVAEVRGYHS